MSISILIVDDEINIRKTLSIALEIHGQHVYTASNGKAGLQQLSSNAIDMVFLDIRLGTENGLDYISEYLAVCPWVKIVIITAHATFETAVKAIKNGAMEDRKSVV